MPELAVITTPAQDRPPALIGRGRERPLGPSSSSLLSVRCQRATRCGVVEHSLGSDDAWLQTAPGFCRSKLSAAAVKQTPTKEAQNSCQGIHAGMIDVMALVIVSVQLRKAAMGTTYQSGPNRISLSNPRAFSQSPPRKTRAYRSKNMYPDKIRPNRLAGYC